MSFTKETQGNCFPIGPQNPEWVERTGPWLAVPGALLLFVLPINHTTAPRMVFLVLGLLGTLGFWRYLRPPRIPLLLPFAACTAVAALSLLTAADPGYSLDEIKRELVYGFVAYASFFCLARSGREIAAWTLSLAAALALLGAYAFITYFREHTLYFDGWHGGVLNYTDFLVTVLPLLLGVLVYPGLAPGWRRLALVLLALSLVTGYLTENRILWVVNVLTCLAFTAIQPGQWKLRAHWPALLVVLLTVAVSIPAFVWQAQSRMQVSTGVVETMSTTGQKDARTRIWAYAIDRIKASPWTGTGFGRMAQAQEFRSHFEFRKGYVHSHNLFLDYGVQMGIPGMAAFTLLFLAIGREFYRLLKAPDATRHVIGAVGICVIVAVLMKSATDNQFIRHNALLFWALVGMGLGYGARLARAHREAGAPPAG